MAVKRLIYSLFIAFIASAATIVILARLATTPRSRTAEKSLSTADIVRHNLIEDCWLIVDGIVYDVTQYIPQHPTAPDIIGRWCGKDASEAFATKGYGRAHSPAAHAMLKEYEIGKIS